MKSLKTDWKANWKAEVIWIGCGIVFGLILKTIYGFFF